MKVSYKSSIGYSNAIRAGEIEINDEELEGMNEKEIERYISDSVSNECEKFIETSWEIKN